MVNITLTYGLLLHFLLVLVRMASFVSVAPFTGGQNTGIPAMVKAGYSVFLTILLVGVVPEGDLQYASVFGYAAIVVKEALCGIILGFASQICFQVTAIAGQVVDMMAGLSMVTTMDPTSGSQVTITATIYSQVITVMMVISGMYRYILRAIADSYNWIPVNGMVFESERVLSSLIDFLRNFFVIGFRVALPVFIVTFVINIVLGVLAKVAPQMNMFAVGMQIKVLVGLFILYLTSPMLGSAADFILQHMRHLVEQFISAMAP